MEQLNELSNDILNERQTAILSELITGRSYSINELAHKFGVSKVTLYSDIEKISKIEIVRRRGRIFVQIPQDPLESTPIGRKLKLNKDLKDAIAGVIVNKYLHPGNRILLDCGTSSLAVAEKIIESQLTGISVFTLNPLIIERFIYQPGEDEIISVGGLLKRNTLAMYGPLTERNLQELGEFDAVIMGVDAVHDNGNLALSTELEIKQKRMMVDKGKLLIVPTDETKICRNVGQVITSTHDIEKKGKIVKLVIGYHDPPSEEIHESIQVLEKFLGEKCLDIVPVEF